MAAYRARKDKGLPVLLGLTTERVKVTDKYTIIGFISSGTYGRVFKAKSRLVYVHWKCSDVAAMDVSLQSKSSSQIRKGRLLLTILGSVNLRCERWRYALTHTLMKLCREVDHINVIRLEEVILDEKCIFMVFEYAEHDLLVYPRSIPLIIEYYPLPCACERYDTYPSIHTSIDSLPTRPCNDVYASSRPYPPKLIVELDSPS